MTAMNSKAFAVSLVLILMLSMSNQSVNENEVIGDDSTAQITSIGAEQQEPITTTTVRMIPSTADDDASTNGDFWYTTAVAGGVTTSGACSFGYYDMKPLLVGGISHDYWKTSLHCGECMEVFGPYGKNTTVLVSDKCSSCKGSEIHISPDAFLELAPYGPTKMDVAWRFVPCSSTKRMVVHTHRNMDRWWIALQIHHVNVQPRPNARWSRMARSDFNYFTYSLSGTTAKTPMRVSVVSNEGQSITCKITQFSKEKDFECNGYFLTNGTVVPMDAAVHITTSIWSMVVVVVILLFV